MSDGALNYALSLSGASGFVGGINSAGGAIASFVGRAGALAAALAAITGGVGALGIAMKSLSAAADMESLTVSMGVLTGSSEKAKQLLGDLREMGASTPYEFPALATGAQTMLSFGIATDQILPLVRMLGDISGGSADKLSSLTLVLGQVASAGRLTGGDLLQFINAGFNPLVQIAQKTGETMSDLLKRMEEGGVGFAEVREAMVAATSAGGMFFGMMDKMSATNTGLISTLKDEVNNLFLAFGQPVNDALKPILQSAIERVSELQPAIASIGEAAATGISRVYAAASSGQLGALLQAELMVVGAHFLNYLGKGLHEAVKGTAVLGNYIAEALSGAGKMLEGALLSAAGSFTSAIADSLASLFESNRLTASFGKKIRESFGSSAITDQAAGAKKEGEGLISGAWSKLMSVGMGSAAVGPDKIAELTADRDKLRTVLDRQTRAEAAAREKAATETTALAAGEAECAKAAQAHETALTKATKQVETAAVALPTTPALLAPPSAIAATGDAPSTLASRSALGRAGRMSAADRAKLGASGLDYLSGKGLSENSALSNASGPSGLDYLAGKGLSENSALAKGSRLAGEAAATLNPKARALGDSNRAAREKPDANRDLASLLKKIEENTAAFADLAVA